MIIIIYKVTTGSFNDHDVFTGGVNNIWLIISVDNYIFCICVFITMTPTYFQGS